MRIGYARVSTEEQDNGRQVEDLKAAGCEVIYQEKVSGMKVSRPELDKMLGELKRGDIVHVLKIDRLGRSLLHLVGLIEQFERDGIGFKSLGDPIDTTSATGKMIFSVLCAVAEFERNMISERTKHALNYRRGQGKKLGRRVKNRGSEGQELARLESEGLEREQIRELKSWSMHEYYSIKKWMRENAG